MPSVIVKPVADLDVQHSAPNRNDSVNRWLKAGIIGTFAGVPTAFFMQVALTKTLKKRGVQTGAPRHWLLPPGIGFAMTRDVGYCLMTQKQVQNAGHGLSTTVEDVGLNAAIVLVPLFFDTLSIKAVQPGFKTPSFRSPLVVLRSTCPPEAVLGRVMFLPLYNWVYVQVQTLIGHENKTMEFVGLAAGSVCASIVAFPFFLFKTNLILLQSQQAPYTDAAHPTNSIFKGANQNVIGVSGFLLRCKQAAVQSFSGRIFSGVGPHMLGNIGPDVLCVGFGRLVFAQLAALNVFAALAAA